MPTKYAMSFGLERPLPPPQKKKNIDQVSELPVVVFVLTRPCRGLESFLASSRHFFV